MIQRVEEDKALRNELYRVGVPYDFHSIRLRDIRCDKELVDLLLKSIRSGEFRRKLLNGNGYTVAGDNEAETNKLFYALVKTCIIGRFRVEILDVSRIVMQVHKNWKHEVILAEEDCLERLNNAEVLFLNNFCVLQIGEEYIKDCAFKFDYSSLLLNRLMDRKPIVVKYNCDSILIHRFWEPAFIKVLLERNFPIIIN